MSKVLPLRRRYCVCGRICADASIKPNNQTESGVHDASNASPLASSSGLYTEKSVPKESSSERFIPPAPPASDAVTLLQLKVRALEKYKTNYELLCSQLAELNTQVGLQLQRHEVDVDTLQSTISSLQTTNASLQHELSDTKQALHSLKTSSDKDREYAAGVHKQLATVAELLKAAEQRLTDQDSDYQDERTRLQTSQEEAATLTSLNAALEAEICALREQVGRLSESEKTRKAYRVEIKHLQSDLEAVREELERQRAVTRQTKKQFRLMREERDVIAKQMESFKADGVQFAAILESQREEMTRQEKKTTKWKKQLEASEQRNAELARSLEDTEMQLTKIQEELVLANTKMEQRSIETKELKQRLDHKQSELNAISLQLETTQAQYAHVQRELEASRQRYEEQAAKKEEHEALEMQRKYHSELQHVKKLLSLNQQRTTESSQDMQVLKQELGSVQVLLRQCHRQRRERKERGGSDTSDDERAWRLRHQRAQAEKAVLQSAIMDQVEEFW